MARVGPPRDGEGELKTVGEEIKAEKLSWKLGRAKFSGFGEHPLRVFPGILFGFRGRTDSQPRGPGPGVIF